MRDVSNAKRDGDGHALARPRGPRTLRRSTLIGSLAAATAMCFAALPGSAGALEFNSAGFLFESSADGTAIHQQRIAVEHSTGNVLAVDVAADEIDVYAPAGGAPIASFGVGELSDPFGVAIDQDTGAVYVSDAGNARIARYTVTPGDPPVYALDAGFSGPAQGTADGEVGDFAASLTVDGASDTLLVADPGNDAVKRFTLAGAYDNLSFNGGDSPEGAFTGPLDIAVDSSGDVVVVDQSGDVASGDPSASSRVLRFSSAGAYEARIGDTLERPATVGIRPDGDQVVVSWNQDAVIDDGFPRLSFFNRAGDALGTVTMPDSLRWSTGTGVAIDDGPTGRLYFGTDVERSGIYGGAFGVWSIQAFDTVPSGAPIITDEAASDVTRTGATLTANVNTDAEPASYYFEYGVAGTGYPLRTPVTPLPISADSQAAAADVSGLEPNTDYEFRVVVDNGVGGPAAGSGGTFITVPLIPTATLGAPTGVTLDSATVHATIDLQGVPGTYGFTVTEVGGPFNLLVPPVEVPASTGPSAASAPIAGLSAGKTYVVGVYVHTAGGTAFADTVNLTTPPRPAVVQPPRQGDDGRSPYGCAAPRLNAVSARVRPGQELTLTGADLGVYGSVMFDGVNAEVRSYAHDRVTVVVPDDVRGSVQLTLDCGHATGPIAVTVASAPSNVASVLSATVRGTRATLRVHVPGNGAISAGGRHLRRAAARPARRGTVVLSVRLTRSGRRALARSRRGRLPVSVTIRYRPAGGSARVVTTRVVFRR